MTRPRSNRVPNPLPAPSPKTADPDALPHEHELREDPAKGTARHGPFGHRLTMIACCVPMLVIVGILVATGVAGSAAILYAFVCLGAMAVMMFAMPGDGHHH